MAALQSARLCRWSPCASNSHGRNPSKTFKGFFSHSKSIFVKQEQHKIKFWSKNPKSFPLHSVKLTTRMEVAETANESTLEQASTYIPSAPILLPHGEWTQVEGGVTAPSGFQACGLYAGLRASGKKPDLSLVFCETDAVVAGTFTKNVMAAAPVIYCKRVLEKSKTARAVLTNAGQANAATGNAGYLDTEECAEALAKILNINSTDVLILSTGVIGKRIKKNSLISALPKLVSSLSPSPSGGGSSAVAITTTDLVSKSFSIQTEIDGKTVKIGGMAKGSGMIHPNMATMLSVITCDANVTSEIWRKMISTSVNRSFNQITVDGDTSTNDTVIALTSCLANNEIIDSETNKHFDKLQAALDALCQGLAKSIAWDGEGATCLIEVDVSGTESEYAASIIAKSVASSSLTKAAIYGRDPNWGRIACAAGYAGIPFDENEISIKLGSFHLMEKGQPLDFDSAAASSYLKREGEMHGTVKISINLGSGSGQSKAWGCDLSYDYVKINAEYTT